ncbi:MAG: helix-turn-helix domain-containing protein [bacterium]|nr:helix-turn-helix domain-containing protein [bacterium]
MTEQKPFHNECHMNSRCNQYDRCPMVTVHQIISGKWKLLILWYLNGKTLRFGDLQRKLPDATQKMLTKQLRSLEQDQLIIRTVYATVPPKVEYRLSDIGQDLIPLLESMHTFGAKHYTQYDENL